MDQEVFRIVPDGIYDFHALKEQLSIALEGYYRSHKKRGSHHISQEIVEVNIPFRFRKSWEKGCEKQLFPYDILESSRLVSLAMISANKI